MNIPQALLGIHALLMRCGVSPGGGNGHILGQDKHWGCRQKKANLKWETGNIPVCWAGNSWCQTHLSCLNLDICPFGALLNSKIKQYTLTLSTDFRPSPIVDSPTCYHVLLLQVDWFIPSSETCYGDLVFNVKTISLFRNWFDTNWFLLLMLCFSAVLEVWEIGPIQSLSHLENWFPIWPENWISLARRQHTVENGGCRLLEPRSGVALFNLKKVPNPKQNTPTPPHFHHPRCRRGKLRQLGSSTEVGAPGALPMGKQDIYLKTGLNSNRHREMSKYCTDRKRNAYNCLCSLHIMNNSAPGQCKSYNKASPRKALLNRSWQRGIALWSLAWDSVNRVLLRQVGKKNVTGGGIGITE